MKKKHKLSHSEKFVNLSTLNLTQFVHGLKLVNLKHSQVHQDKHSIIKKTSCHLLMTILMMRHYHKLRNTSFIVELVPKSKLKTYNDKLNSCDLSFQPMNLLQIVLQELILKEWASRPFWNTQCQEFSKKLWLPTEIDSRVSGSNSSSELLKYKAEKSQFWKILETCQQNKSWLKTYYQSFISTTADKWEKEDIEKKLYKTKTIRLIPTQSQKQTFQEWRHTARYVYNKTLATLKSSNDIKTKYDLRNELVTKTSYKCSECKKLSKSLECQSCHVSCEVIKNDSVADWETKTPKEIRFSALKSVLTSYKSANTNLKNGNISGFNLGFKKKSRTSKRDCIDIDKNSVKFEDGHIKIYSKILKDPIKIGLRSKKSLKDFDLNDHCKLHFDGKYYNLMICRELKAKERQAKTQDYKILALDPGTSKFMTGYDPDGKVIEIDRDQKLITRLKRKLDLLQKLRKRKSSLDKVRSRIKNHVTEMHWQSINMLTKQYNVIILPHFKSHEMVKGSNKHGLNRNMMILSHYKFLTRLIYKAQMLENTCVIHRINESYTTQTCGRCGDMHKLSLDERTYVCKRCDMTMTRDINAARNILMKTLVEYK